MFDITQLNSSLSMPVVAGSSGFGLQLKVVTPADSALPFARGNAMPKVTWRVTRSCNVNCLNCAPDSQPHNPGSELTTLEGKALIRDLAAMGVTRLQFAGGEPLVRKDLLELVAYTREQGIESSILTNGTLLTRETAGALKGSGLHSATIMLEGIGGEVDFRRGTCGAGSAVLEGYANCEAAGIAAEIRIPLSRGNYPGIPGILDLIERRKIRKAVFAHLVNTGRGHNPHDEMTHDEKRNALDLILERAEDFHCRGVDISIATDENHTDAIYFYLRLARENPRRAAAAFRMLPAYGALVQGSGVGIAGIDSMGNVHPDPYWTNYVLGNIRQTPFGEIWGKSSDPLLKGLRNRLPLLKGRCGNCQWKQTCGGNLRVRSEEAFGNPWMSDPACYLTNKEISKEVIERYGAMEDDVLLSEQAA